LDGSPVQVLSATPFQINGVIPGDLSPGVHVLHIESPFGIAQQAVMVSPVSPAIFLLGSPPVAALVNQDGSLNGPASPAIRGQVVSIYATGLGAVTRQSAVSPVSTPVTVVLNGQEITPEFAGLAPGIPGEYQVNVLIPAATPPGVAISFTLKQGGQASNPVTLALQ
jgi:uncharacterized protein (TIGR03437 family)